MEITKINPEGFKTCLEHLKNKEALLLDVRTEEEWEAGHAEGAMHLELSKIEAGELPDFPKDKKICVYCAAGGRAEMAKKLLLSKGFLNVHNLGGLRDWKAAGGSVVK